MIQALLLLLMGQAAGTPAPEPPAQTFDAPPSETLFVPRTPRAAAPTPASAALGDAFDERWNVVEFGELSEHELLRAAASDAAPVGARYRVGLQREVQSGPIPLDGPRFRPTLDAADRLLWTLRVRSTGSHGLRLRLEGLDLEPGAELIIYGRDADGTVRAKGPFRGRGPRSAGEFWTPWTPGDTAWIEVRSETPPRGRLAALAHFDRHPGGLDGALSGPGLPPTLGCHLNAQCYKSGPAEAAFNATAQYCYMSDGQAFVCSGTLLADLDDGADGYYFLTAEHCIANTTEANSMQIVWFWQADICGPGATLPVFANLPTNNGALLLASDGAVAGNDTAFLRLYTPPPAGVQFAGWTTADMPPSAYGFHHPAGSFKRYTSWIDSWHIFCQFWDSAYYHFVEKTAGAFEGGSSGSALFNDAGQVLGQAYGYCGIDADCDPDGWRGLFGEFENTYVLACDVGLWTVGDWLKIGATVTVDSSVSASAPQLGTPGEPFKILGPAYGTIWDGGRMRVRDGSYPGPHLFTKRLELFNDGGGSAVLGL